MTYNTLSSHPYRTNHNTISQTPPAPLTYPTPSSNHTPSFTPTSVSDRKAHEAAKARKIKEYLGIAANISDWDFEALQNDIQALGKSLISEDDSDPVPQPTNSLLQFTPTVHVPLPGNKSTEEEKPHSPSIQSSLPSDTESESEEFLNEEDEELQLLHNYESDQFSIAWRWYWLQLQVKDIQYHIEKCNQEIKDLRENKESCVPSKKEFEENCSRSVGWNKLQENRKLCSPASSALRLRLGNSFHPLFPKKPKKFVLPKQQTQAKPSPVIDPLTQSHDSEPSTPSSSRKKANRNRTPSRRSPSTRRTELTSSQKSRPLVRKTSDYDIDDVVLPMMTGTVRKIRKIKYKEILTPTFRDINPSYNLKEETNENSSSDENTDDEVYANRHAPKEQDERVRFAIPPPTTQKKQSTDSLRTSNSSENIPKRTTPQIDRRASTGQTPTPKKQKKKQKKKRRKSTSSASSTRIKLSRPIFTIKMDQNEATSQLESPETEIIHTKRRRKPSQKRKEMSNSTPDFISTEEVHSPLVNRNYRYPDSIYVSSLTPSITKIKSPPKHSHNTRRSALATTIFGNETIPVPNTKRKRGTKNKKNKNQTNTLSKSLNDCILSATADSSGTKILLRIAQNTIPTPLQLRVAPTEERQATPPEPPVTPVVSVDRNQQVDTKIRIAPMQDIDYDDISTEDDDDFDMSASTDINSEQPSEDTMEF